VSLAQPRPVPPGVDTAAEPTRLNVVEASAAVADPDLPQARPLPGQVRAEWQAQARAGVGVCALPATTKVPAAVTGADRMRRAIASSC